MVHKLTEDWHQEYFGPFVRRDNEKVTLATRSVEDGFVVYTSTDGVKYHASGRCFDKDDNHQIDGRYVAKTVRRRKKKAQNAHRQDTRLAHLLKLQTQARRDVTRYVNRKWPEGKNIKFTHRGEKCQGVVAGHDTIAAIAVVIMDDKRKLRIPYASIIDRKVYGL